MSYMPYPNITNPSSPLTGSLPVIRRSTGVQSWLWSSRKIAGLSQRELADRTGISRDYIHAIEVGRRWPSILVALKLSAALGISVEKLFSMSEATD